MVVGFGLGWSLLRPILTEEIVHCALLILARVDVDRNHRE